MIRAISYWILRLDSARWVRAWWGRSGVGQRRPISRWRPSLGSPSCASAATGPTLAQEEHRPRRTFFSASGSPALVTASAVLGWNAPSKQEQRPSSRQRTTPSDALRTAFVAYDDGLTFRRPHLSAHDQPHSENGTPTDRPCKGFCVLPSSLDSV